MPMRPPRACGCGATVPAGQRCACQVARKAQRDKGRLSARQRGYTRQWDVEAKAYLAMNPTCRRCGAPSAAVDHIIPHRGDDELFWDRSNWQPLCAPCHNRKTAGRDGGFGNRRGVVNDFPGFPGTAPFHFRKHVQKA